MKNNTTTESNALLITGKVSLDTINRSINSAYSMTLTPVPVDITVSQRFECNANNRMVPVSTVDTPVNLIVTEQRCFGGNPKDIVIHACVVDDVTLPGDYELCRGDFVDIILCLDEGIGEFVTVMQLDGSVKFEFPSTGVSTKFADTERLVLPYACR